MTRWYKKAIIGKYRYMDIEYIPRKCPLLQMDYCHEKECAWWVGKFEDIGDVSEKSQLPIIVEAHCAITQSYHRWIFGMTQGLIAEEYLRGKE